MAHELTVRFDEDRGITGWKKDKWSNNNLILPVNMPFDIIILCI